MARDGLSLHVGVEDTDNSSARSKKNPYIADWFFYHRIVKFMDVFYKGILKANDYWLRFKYQQRGSPRVHGAGWLQDAPDVELEKTQVPPLVATISCHH